jgi:diadenosine tetraphosphatase ApaH/serine/threonine PP2A family protein phosphatase
MRVAFIGDVHGNYDALEAVLKDMDSMAPDAAWCLGDIVGYGAEPKLCVEAVRGRSMPVVGGNHDYAVAGTGSIEYFNPEAREGVLWTRSELDAAEHEYLASLPLVHRADGFLAAHGALAEPAAFEYILTMYDAAISFDYLDCEFGFTAHSHCPMTFLHTGDELHAVVEPKVAVAEGVRAIVNVGSVGQPRDGVPLAAYAIFDVDKREAEIRRVEYDVERAAQKILDAGLPEMNARRLIVGR